MASILVYIEPAADAAGAGPLPSSLEALGEARRIATALGAPLYAAAPFLGPASGETDPDAEHKLVELLGRCGADRVVLMPMPMGTGPAMWASHGEALHAVYERVQPRLVLLSATRAGCDLAPRLAARARAQLMAEPRLQTDADGALALGDLERPVIATLRPGAHQPARGEDEAEVLLMQSAPAQPRNVEYLSSSEDPGAALDTARVIVVAGAGVRTAEGYALVGELAAALGAELGATHDLCARGLAPAHRVIDVGARRVAPALYIVCAASGSRTHLDAVSGNPDIIAINSDPEAPVFQVARYGIVGPIEDVIPALIEALAGRLPAAVSS